jgi:hypothetical protein
MVNAVATDQKPMEASYNDRKMLIRALRLEEARRDNHDRPVK